MAPIDPIQLLKAFEPYLTPKGGVKNVEQVPRLSSLMKKYSKKLVSRCVYCNVLLNTDDDVLNEFLEQDGWDTINSWLKTAKETDNTPFLVELLKLLAKCPISVIRLKQNDTAKLVKTLSKDENEDIARMAKTLVKSWMKLIKGENAENGDATKDENNHRMEKKKRKKDGLERQSSESEEGSTDSKIRRVKVNHVRHSHDSSRDSESTLDLNDNNSADSELKFETRAPTAKIRLGKSRGLGLLEDIQSSVRQKTDLTSKKFAGGGLSRDKPSKVKKEPVISHTVNRVAPLKIKIGRIENGTPIAIKVIEPKPMPITVAGPASGGATSAAEAAAAKVLSLKESAGFIDAILDTSAPVRKKKKPAVVGRGSGDAIIRPDKKEANEEDESDSESQDVSGPNLTSAIEEQIEADMRVDFMESVEDVPNEAIAADGDDYKPTIHRPSDGCFKSILVYSRSRTNTKKKSVKWLPDDLIKKVKFFELDESERTNVSRPVGSSGVSDNKAEGLSLIGGRPHPEKENHVNSAVEFFPWVLKPFDLPPNYPVVDFGNLSKEREIQRQRQKATLAEFYPSKALAPDFPKEPDAFEGLAGAHEAPKEIPLEDEKSPGIINDYSLLELPAPKPDSVGQTASVAAPGPAFSPNQGLPGGGGFPPPGHGMGLPHQIGGQPMMSSYSSTQGPPPPNHYGHQPAPYHDLSSQSYYQPPLSGSNCYPTPTGPPQPPPGTQFGNYQPRHSHRGHGFRPSGPRGGRAICRHFLKSGSCRYMPNCNFLHQYPLGHPMGQGKGERERPHPRERLGYHYSKNDSKDWSNSSNAATASSHNNSDSLNWDTA